MKVYKHASYSYVTVVEVPYSEIEKLDLSICAQPKETIPSFYNRQTIKPDVIMNAGFFGLSGGDSCFNLVDDGVVYGKTEKYQYGFGIAADHKRFEYGALSIYKSKWVDFISGYPNLIDSGKSCAPWTFATEINYKAARSIAAYDDKNIYFITVDKPSGMNFNQMAEMLLDMGIKYAINCDGGGSTRMHVGGEVVNTPTENRAVDNVLCIYLTEEAKKAYYKETDSDYYIYTVVSGDSWWKIAKTQLGDPYLYPKLQEYNNWISGQSLNVGAKIKIPNNKFKETEEETKSEETTTEQQPTTSTDNSSTKTEEVEKKEEDTSAGGTGGQATDEPAGVIEVVTTPDLSKGEVVAKIIKLDNVYYFVDKDGQATKIAL